MVRKKKKIIIKKPIEVGTIFKTVNGKKFKYVKVVLRSKGKKTKVKQYRYRGGKFNLYINEAKLPKGTRYFVNYRKNQIIRNPREIDSLLKAVRDRKKVLKRKKKQKQILKRDFSIIPKRVKSPPRPIESIKLVPSLLGKVYYEREHSITEFYSYNNSQKFLTNIVSKGTKSIRDARRLVNSFKDIALKLSYSIVIEGIDEQGNQKQICSFTTIGKTPYQISTQLKDLNLLPGDDYKDVYSDIIKPFKTKLSSANVQFNEYKGNFRITDARVVVKFYNNPQKRLV